jgi:hypothetical protein
MPDGSWTQVPATHVAAFDAAPASPSCQLSFPLHLRLQMAAMPVNLNYNFSSQALPVNNEPVAIRSPEWSFA